MLFKRGTLVEGMRCRIYIVRHAESTDNAKGIFSGWRDPSLTARGKVEARKVASQLRRERIDVAFSSTRKRALQTLHLALGGRKVATVLDDRIIERSYGRLQGTRKKAAELRLGPRGWGALHRGYATVPTAGESVKMVEKRVNAFICELEWFLHAHPCNVLISCHGNSMRPLRKHYQHLSNGQMMALENPQDHAVIVTYYVPGRHDRLSKRDERHVNLHFPGKRVVKETLPGQMKKRF